MGAIASLCCRKEEEIRAKFYVLQGELRELSTLREEEAIVYEQKALEFQRREEDWNKEKKRLEVEMIKLRKSAESKKKEEGEKCRGMTVMGGAAAAGDDDDGGGGGDKGERYEVFAEERQRREETAEKWKKLYLEIKAELDDLIVATRRGERFRRGFEEGVMEDLRRDLGAKEELMAAMKAQLSAAEREGRKKDREIDILRQSLRILGSGGGGGGDGSSKRYSASWAAVGRKSVERRGGLRTRTPRKVQKKMLY